MSTKSIAKAKPNKPNIQGQFDTKNVVQKLEDLMDGVTADDITPETVNAACNCADKITDILRLHLDYDRLRSRFPNDKP